MQWSMPVRSFWKPCVLAAATVCVGAAHASSIVTLTPMSEPLGPSMIVAGAPDAAPAAEEAEDRRMVSRSILAFGPPNVAYENVASVGNKPDKQRRGFSPMVLRGGIAGGAFPSPSSPEPAFQPAKPLEAKAPEGDDQTLQPPEQDRQAAAPPPGVMLPEPE